jgi:hypothetical protein
MSTKRTTGWYWLPAEPGEKVDWHPAFYDAERDRIWIAQCSGAGWRPSQETLSRPALSPSQEPEAVRSPPS